MGETAVVVKMEKWGKGRAAVVIDNLAKDLSEDEEERSLYFMINVLAMTAVSWQESEEGDFQAWYAWTLTWMTSKQEWLNHGLEEKVILVLEWINASIPVTVASTVCLAKTEVSLHETVIDPRKVEKRFCNYIKKGQLEGEMPLKLIHFCDCGQMNQMGQLCIGIVWRIIGEKQI